MDGNGQRTAPRTSMNRTRPRRRRQRGASGMRLFLLTTLAVVLSGPTVRATSPDSNAASPGITALPEASLQRWIAAPAVAEGAIGMLPVDSSTNRVLARGADAPFWTALPQAGRQLIDDFDAADWPDRARWPLVADLNAPFVARAGYPWAASGCESPPGTRSLRAVGGGDGATLDCDAAYPAAVASSALLSLDLSRMTGAHGLSLRFDLWVEADPEEGLLVNLLRFTDGGEVAERRIVYSATGRLGAWARDQAIDLTMLQDALDGRWQGDLRGERAYLEFLFVSADGGEGGARGVLMDDLTIEAVYRAPTATPSPAATAQPTQLPGPSPTPPPPGATATPEIVDRTTLCTSIRDCTTLSVRAWIDRGCDGRFQTGLDAPLRTESRVDGSAGGEALGTALGRTGRTTFSYPGGRDAEFRLALPDGYAMCDGSANPAVINADDVNRYGRATVNFRLQRTP